MVLIININNGIKEPTHGYQNFNTNHILIVSGYLKMYKYFHGLVIVWVNTILNHVNTTASLPWYEDSCMIYNDVGMVSAMRGSHFVVVVVDTSVVWIHDGIYLVFNIMVSIYHVRTFTPTLNYRSV